MRISIFGLGYVGVVTAACLSEDGYVVMGVDINEAKVDLINSGESPIIEPGLDTLLAQGLSEGRIKATTSSQLAIQQSELSMISVGTPAMKGGEPDLSFVWGVCKDIAAAVSCKGRPHIVVLRSTVPPGTLQKCEALFDQIVGPGKVHCAFNPEFLREGSAIADYRHPPYTIIGTRSAIAETALQNIYDSIDSPKLVLRPEEAEMTKYAANTWHAMKVSFANEIGRVAKAWRLDGQTIMDVVVQDTYLNISPAYLRPGFAYGGSCLPKDLAALLYYARTSDVPVPLLNMLPTTNRFQIDLALQTILETGVRHIAMLGLAFKPNTDDLRESPFVILVKLLLGEGVHVKIYDQAVSKARLMGTNLTYIHNNIPHFEALLQPTPEAAIEGTELIVLAHQTPEILDAISNIPEELPVLDLVGANRKEMQHVNYMSLAA